MDQAECRYCGMFEVPETDPEFDHAVKAHCTSDSHIGMVTLAHELIDTVFIPSTKNVP